MYSHLLLILLIPMFTVWFLLAWPRGKRRLLGFVVTLAALTLPYLPMVWWQWDFLTSPDQLTAIPFTPLDTLLESVLLTQTYGVLTPTALYLLAPIVTLLAYGLLVGLKFDAGRRGGATLLLEAWRYHLLIVSWLVIPVLLIYLLSLRQPVFLPRYIIWIAPAVMILIAWGAHFIWHNGRSAGRVFATVLVVYALTLWTYLGWLQKSTEVKTDLRSAVRYVLQYRDPKDLLILQVPHLEIAYRYYSSDQGRFPFRGSDDRLGWWQGGLWTNNGLGDDEFRRLVDLAMQDITGGATGIWVMRSEAETWDARNLMGEWLDQNMMLVEEVEYHLADVRFYRR